MPALTSAAEFVASLAAAPKLTSVFNPWCQPGLQANLVVYLRTLHALCAEERVVPILIVGEALGYKGGRNTGIPFSSSQLFADIDHPFLRQLAPLLTLTRDDSENTATIVWDYLCAKKAVPLFWNAFPFHPHRKHRPNSNRKPTAGEVRRGIPYLQQLAEIFQPSQIAGLGRVGQQAAQQAFPNRDIGYIRHPSYGGKQEFVTGMDALL